jgi:hypothetical protein
MTYHAITLYEMTCNQPPPKIFINPTDPANGDGTYNDSGWGIYSITGYVANFEAMGGLVDAPSFKVHRIHRILDITDGTSNTIMYTTMNGCR